MELMIWQWALLFGGAFFMSFVLSMPIARSKWYRRRQAKRGSHLKRYVDHHGARLKDIALEEAGPGNYVRFEMDDGLPGGPRGLVWTEKERAAYRRKLQRLKMRIVGSG